jgi:hypothetical protein
MWKALRFVFIINGRMHYSMFNVRCSMFDVHLLYAPKVYCPRCSQSVATDCDNRVWDNDWVLELNMEVVQAHIPVMDIAPEDVTADRIFDEGYVTWVGITPDDHQTREQERNQIQKLAKTDLLAYIQAMKEWGLNREKRFVNEGWRKMRARATH